MGTFVLYPDEDSTKLFLVDSRSSDFTEIWQNLSNGENINGSRCLYALCNADKELHIESEAVACGIWGIFYNQEPFQNFPKGITAMITGELWFSRKHDWLNNRVPAVSPNRPVDGMIRYRCIWSIFQML